jgi:hypothetical protein
MADEEQGELPIVQMIDLAATHQFNKATEIFNDLIGQKMTARLDQEKIAMANQVFNGIEPEEDNEEQLELDIDDQEELDNEEEIEADDIEVDEADVDEDDGDDGDEEEPRED